MKRAVFFLVASTLFLALSIPAHADIRSDMAAGLPLGQVLGNAIGNVGVEPTNDAVTASVKAMVENGAGVDQLVKIALGSGYDPCAVIKGVITGGGSVTAVVQAAMSENLDADSLAVCCKDAGADPELVASAIADFNAGKYVFGYSTPGNGAATGGDSSGSIPSGGRGGGGADISPRR